jgi:hypothetical protein
MEIVKVNFLLIYSLSLVLICLVLPNAGIGFGRKLGRIFGTFFLGFLVISFISTYRFLVPVIR